VGLEFTIRRWSGIGIVDRRRGKRLGDIEQLGRERRRVEQRLGDERERFGFGRFERGKRRQLGWYVG
jgi:hypothetical protein